MRKATLIFLFLMSYVSLFSQMPIIDNAEAYSIISKFQQFLLWNLPYRLEPLTRVARVLRKSLKIPEDNHFPSYILNM
jgi:hypothetical protein